MRPADWGPFQWMLFLGTVWVVCGLLIDYLERRK